MRVRSSIKDAVCKACILKPFSSLSLNFAMTPLLCTEFINKSSCVCTFFAFFCFPLHYFHNSTLHHLEPHLMCRCSEIHSVNQMEYLDYVQRAGIEVAELQLLERIPAILFLHLVAQQCNAMSTLVAHGEGTR